MSDRTHRAHCTHRTHRTHRTAAPLRLFCAGVPAEGLTCGGRGGRVHRAGAKRSRSPTVTARTGAAPRQPVVFPLDCASLHEAILQCAGGDADAAAEVQTAGECRKRGRQEDMPPGFCSPSSEHADSNRAAIAHVKRPACMRRVLVQYGYHCVGEDAVAVNAAGAWSICGLGDVSGEVDLAQLQALAVRVRAASTLSSDATLAKGRVARSLSVAEMKVQGASAVAASPPLGIPLPCSTFPLLPSGRYNVAQMLEELACASQVAAPSPLAREHGGAGACGAPGCSQEAEASNAAEHWGKQSASAILAPRARPGCKQTRINPFEALMQEPEETQVEGGWRLGEATSGVVRDLCCLLPVDHGRKLSALMLVFGGPWLLEHTRLQSNGRAILRLCSMARAHCRRSVLEGASLLSRSCPCLRILACS